MNEEWRDVVGYEGIYQVSDLGRVRSLDRDIVCSNGVVEHVRGKVLRPHLNNGYMELSLHKNGRAKAYKVHRLVAFAFIDRNPDKPHVDHINGIRDDNRPCNLRFVTSAENNAHKIELGNCRHYSETASKKDDADNDYDLPGEVWKVVSGYDGYYEVSNMGRVRSVTHTDDNGILHKGKILKPKKERHGYLRVHLSMHGKSCYKSVHRLVALAFCTKPDGMDIVNHLDCNTANNNAENLEWTDYRGNMQHASKMGHMHGNMDNLVNAQDARKIPVVAISKDGSRSYFESGSEAARQLGIRQCHIAECCRQEYGYKSLNGYRFEYADKSLQEEQKPRNVGMTHEEMREFTRKRMIGNKYNVGRKTSESTKNKLRKSLGKKVAKIDRSTREILEVYDSVSYAEKTTGISHICDVVLGKRNTAGGFMWSYI